MEAFLEYPKWVAVTGEGHADYPGHEMAESAEHEAALTAPPKPGRPRNRPDPAQSDEE